MNLEPKILANRFVRLEPMAEAHKADLRAACAADPGVWAELYPYSMLGPEFDRVWAQQFEQPGPTWLPFAVVVDGRCMGQSSYLAIDPANQSVEIGGTYYHPEVRGGATNPAAKRLLLENAFASGARRVQFKVDAINARSRAAVTKLGAVQEGILRQDRVCWTGRVRDTVIFSVLSDEWPGVRARLEARLAALE